MQIKRLWITGFLLLLSSSSGFCLEPINSDIGFTASQGQFIFRELLSFSEATGAGKDVDKIVSRTSIVYGLTSRQTLMLVVPVVNAELETSGPNGNEVEREAGGLGDIVLFHKFRFFTQDAFSFTQRLSLISGIKLPTGDNTRSDKLGRLPSSVQPGSGSVDFIIGTAYSMETKKIGVHGDLVYKINTNDNSVRMGNTLRFDAAFVYTLYPSRITHERKARLFGVMELNGTQMEQSRGPDGKNSDSGGVLIFASPGLTYVFPRGDLQLEFSYSIPVVTDFNGNQPEPDRVLSFGLKFFH